MDSLQRTLVVSAESEDDGVSEVTPSLFRALGLIAVKPERYAQLIVEQCKEGDPLYEEVCAVVRDFAPHLRIPIEDVKQGRRGSLAEGSDVLVVDDEAGIRELYSALLAKDYGVDSAADGYEAIGKVLLRKHSGEEYRVILMDLLMREYDGVKTAHFMDGLEGKYEVHSVLCYLSAYLPFYARTPKGVVSEKGFTVGGDFRHLSHLADRAKPVRDLSALVFEGIVGYDAL